MNDYNSAMSDDRGKDVVHTIGKTIIATFVGIGTLIVGFIAAFVLSGIPSICGPMPISLGTIIFGSIVAMVVSVIGTAAAPKSPYFGAAVFALPMVLCLRLVFSLPDTERWLRVAGIVICVLAGFIAAKLASHVFTDPFIEKPAIETPDSKR